MSPVEEYVDDLAGRLWLSPRRRERLLAEVEEHLHDAASREARDGRTLVEAQRAAVRRFGPAAQVAYDANGGARGAIERFVGALARVGAVGCAAILLGTVVARLVARFTSTAWVYALPAEAHPSQSRIAHWLAVHPGTTSWRTAAMLENSADSLSLRGGAAMLGLLVCVAVALLVSRRYRLATTPILSMPVVAAFAVAGIGLIGFALARVPVAEWGRGQGVVDGAVALLFAGGYAAYAHRLGRRQVA